MISIQLLYSRQVPRTINCDPDMLGKGAASITIDDILCILGQIQAKKPIGNAVLDAQIALDKSARRMLESAVIGSLIANDCDSCIAKALANVALFEVCESPVCPRCKGTGLFAQANKGMVECTKCNGVGNFIPSDRLLHKMVIERLPEERRFCRNTFKKRWYDKYMDIVDKLHAEAGEASLYAKQLLREIEYQDVV